jgi:glycosyltransferase involved in cell wall biosynthesis
MARIVDTVSTEVNVALVTRDRDLGMTIPYPGLSGRWTRRSQAMVFYLDIASARQWLRLLRDLRTTPFDVLYVNSLWSPLFTVLPIVAVYLSQLRVRRVVVAPRGELSPGALSLKARKKRLFLRCWGPLLRRTAVTWHACAEREAAEIRTVFPWADVQVSPVQVALPAAPLAPETPGDIPALVFIGRVAAMKNVKLILEALCRVSGQARFDIYGPLEDPAYWAACTRLIGAAGSNVTVRYRGELEPAKVCGTFAGYDAFVFPTLGENFGHVIAESLAASCPVICSDATPWSAVLRSGGGVALRELTVECLAVELDRILRRSPEERLRAKVAAGQAYRAWRRSDEDANILDRLAQR